MQFAQFPLVSHDAWTYPLLWRHANLSLFIDYSTYSEKTELSRHLARRHKKTRWRLVLCTTILIHGPIFIHEALPTPIKTVLQCRAGAHLRNFSCFVFGLVLVRSIYSSLIPGSPFDSLRVCIASWMYIFGIPFKSFHHCSLSHATTTPVLCAIPIDLSNRSVVSAVSGILLSNRKTTCSKVNVVFNFNTNTTTKQSVFHLSFVPMLLFDLLCLCLDLQPLLFSNKKFLRAL